MAIFEKEIKTLLTFPPFVYYVRPRREWGLHSLAQLLCVTHAVVQNV